MGKLLKIGHISILILLTFGCTQKLFKSSYMKRNNPDMTVSVPSAPAEKNTEMQEDCLRMYFLFPDKLTVDKGLLYKNICPKSDGIHNVELTRHFFIIPLIYSKDCFVLTADCGK